MTASVYELWYGRPEPPAEPRKLRAGPVTALLEGPDLRYVRFGGVEAVRRVYVAVRDQNWNTIPGELSNFGVDGREDSFDVRFESRHRAGPVDFSWRGTIEGAAEGTITYGMDGESHSEFRYNRIGICLLHPPSVSGALYLGRGPDG